MTVYVHDTQFLTRRGAVLVLIIGLHLFIAWALATGLARRAMEVIAPPIQTDIVEEVKQEKEPPPPPPPEFEKPPVEVPPPDVQITLPVETAPTTAITAVAATQHAPAPPPRPSNRTAAGPGKNFPNCDDYYPPASRRLEEQGVTVIAFCVDGSGKLTGDPTIGQSSGSARLDEAGLKCAKSGSGRYKAPTEDGKAVAGCGRFAVRFQIK
jgi:protein TonB